MATGHRTRTTLTLFSASNCMACHQVRLVLAAKGVTHELILSEAARPHEDLLDLNPYHSVPTLIDRDLVLYETAVICEYLDERYPHPPLMPIDPLGRARVRLALYRIQRDWLSDAALVADSDASIAEPARHRLRESLIAAVPLFKASRFFLSSDLTIADCALLPLLWRLPVLGLALAGEAQPIIDYGERLFRANGFSRSLTEVERNLREAGGRL